ncbi:hypothetical protein CGC20_29525 [Leishmania donovani]|uniref:Uncharacterized protein n=1 Tax=Leishmania donovani TaxID=5661 RepID=A0A504X266_LEIDO|nr:hypothetical protein CGC20_29525 [Leishmania donovani]
MGAAPAALRQKHLLVIPAPSLDHTLCGTREPAACPWGHGGGRLVSADRPELALCRGDLRAYVFGRCEWGHNGTVDGLARSGVPEERTAAARAADLATALRRQADIPRSHSFSGGRLAAAGRSAGGVLANCSAGGVIPHARLLLV